MTVLKNCMVGQTKVLKRGADEARDNAMKYLEKVGMAPLPQRQAPPSSPAARSSAWPSPAPWPWIPEVLLFDEPTSALDPEMVGEVLSVMREPGRLRA